MVQQSSHSHNVGQSISSVDGVGGQISAQQQAHSQALLNKAGANGNESDGSEDFEEPPDQRAILHVLSNLPGISATDSRSYRIEALRVHLENQLGD